MELLLVKNTITTLNGFLGRKTGQTLHRSTRTGSLCLQLRSNRRTWETRVSHYRCWKSCGLVVTREAFAFRERKNMAVLMLTAR